MDIVLVSARLLLALVFFVAGISKLFDRAGAKQALIEFGIPGALATPLGAALPITELAVAVSLIPVASAWWGAAIALALLLIFVTAISLSLIHGKTLECHCFGQLYSAPISRSTLVRNTILAGMAGLIIVRGFDNPGPSAIAWMGSLTVAGWVFLVGGIALFGLLVIQGWVLLNLMRQNGRLLLRVDALEAQIAIAKAGLPVGAFAPHFQLPDLNGEIRSSGALFTTGIPVLLVFWDPKCRPCLSLLPEMGRWQRDYSSRLNVVVISRGEVNEIRAKAEMWNLAQVLVQDNHKVSQAYKVSGTPAAVIVHHDGRIGSSLAVGTREIEELVAGIMAISAVELTQVARNGGQNYGQRAISAEERTNA